MTEDLSNLMSKIADLESKYSTYASDFNNLNIKVASKLSKHDLKSSNVELKSILVGTGLVGNLSVDENGKLTVKKNVSSVLKTIFQVDANGKLINNAGLEVQDSVDDTVLASVSNLGKGMFKGLDCWNENLSIGTRVNGGTTTYAYIDYTTGDIAARGFVQSRNEMKVLNFDVTRISLKNDGTIKLKDSAGTSDKITLSGADGTGTFDGVVTCNASMVSPASTTLVTKAYVDGKITPAPLTELLTGNISYGPPLSKVTSGYTVIFHTLTNNGLFALPIIDVSEYGRFVTIINADSTYTVDVRIGGGTTFIVNQDGSSNTGAITIPAGGMVKFISYGLVYRIIDKSY